jgi:hypothetical protein
MAAQLLLLLLLQVLDSWMIWALMQPIVEWEGLSFSGRQRQLGHSIRDQLIPCD